MSGLVTPILDVFAVADVAGVVTAAAGGAIRVDPNAGAGADGLDANVAKASLKALTDGGPGTIGT